MSNELEQIKDGILDLNKNIGSIATVLASKSINDVTIQSNLRNAKKESIGDVISKAGSTIKTSIVNAFNKLGQNSIEKTTSKIVEATNKKNIVKSKEKLSVVATDKTLNSNKKMFYQKALDFFKDEKTDRTKNVQKSLYQKTLDKGVSAKNKIVNTGKKIADKGGSFLDNIALLGLGAYAIYEALTSKVGKWTGTIKLIGKTLIGAVDKVLLKPLTFIDGAITKLIKTTFNALKPRNLEKGLSKVIGVDRFKGLTRALTSFSKSISDSFIGTIGKGIGKMFKPIVSAQKFILKPFANLGAKLLKPFSKFAGKSALKKIPVLGALFGIGFGIKRFMNNDLFGGMLEIASGLTSLIPVPFLGTALGLGIDLFLAKRDYDKGDNFKYQPMGEQLKNGFKSIFNKIDLTKLPIVGPLLNTYKSITSLAKGDFKGALQYMGKGLLSTVPLLPQAIDFFTGIEEFNNTSAKIVKSDVKTTVNKAMKKSAENFKSEVEKLDESYKNGINNVTSTNNTYYNEVDRQKLREKKDDDNWKKEMLKEQKRTNNNLEEKNTFDRFRYNSSGRDNTINKKELQYV